MNPILLLTAAGFFILTIVFFWLLLNIINKAIQLSSWDSPKKKRVSRNATMGVVAWIIFLTVWSLAGVSARFDLFPLNFAPVLAVPMITILLVTFSGKMKVLLPLIPEKSLVNLQVFRVFVEILLWALFIQNLLPIQMTFEGRNFDILSGLTAPIAALLLIRSKPGMIIWNILCLGLLINIVTVAILSMPVSFRAFENEPSNIIVASFPYIFLPGMLVPLAYGLSFLSIRQYSLK
jgi:hypothetical protein